MYQPSEELRNLQLRCLKILDVVDAMCRKHGIEYSLCGGSVVGAYLYSGFIPWDDDIDLMMTRKNYEKFIKVCRKELPKQYEIHNYKTSKEYYTLFTKIVDKTTTLVQGEIVSGVFLDITVYDKVPNSKFKDLIYRIAGLASGTLYWKPEDGKLLKNIAMRILGNNCSWLYRCCEVVFRLFSHCKNYSYSELFGAFCNTKPYAPAIYENYSDIQFEGKKYRIVRDHLDYLVCRYERTDFHEPEERQVPTHYTYVDFNLPYRKYKNG